MKLEILDPLPPPVDDKTAPAERLARRVWRTFGRQCLPLAEMSHVHLLNLPGFILRRIRDIEDTYTWPTSDKMRAAHARWHGWLAAVTEEIARRAPGDVWMDGYPPPKGSILAEIARKNHERVLADARLVLGRHIVEAELGSR